MILKINNFKSLITCQNYSYDSFKIRMYFYCDLQNKTDYVCYMAKNKMHEHNMLFPTSHFFLML